MRKLIFTVLTVSILFSAPRRFLKYIKTIYLKGSSENIRLLCDAKYDEGYFYILDPASQYKLKIYDVSGKFIKEMARKGSGPGEFLEPIGFGIYKDRMVIAEKRTFDYVILDKKTLQNVYKKFTNFKMGFCNVDLILTENKLITSDWYIRFLTTGKDETFHGVVYDLVKGKKKLLWKNIYWKTTKKALTNSKIDVAPDGKIYMVYNQPLILRVYSENGRPLMEKEIDIENYIYPTRVEIESFHHFLKSWDHKDKENYLNYIQNWVERYSWLQKVVVKNKYIFIFFRNYDEDIDGWKLWYAVVDRKGNLVRKETPLRSRLAGGDFWIDAITPAIRIFYSPDKKFLYIARQKDDEEEDISIEVYRFIVK